MQRAAEVASQVRHEQRGRTCAGGDPLRSTEVIAFSPSKLHSPNRTSHQRSPRVLALCSSCPQKAWHQWIEMNRASIAMDIHELSRWITVYHRFSTDLRPKNCFKSMTFHRFTTYPCLKFLLTSIFECKGPPRAVKDTPRRPGWLGASRSHQSYRWQANQKPFTKLSNIRCNIHEPVSNEPVSNEPTK